MKVHRELNNFLFGLPFIALWWGWCSLLGPPGMFPTRSSWMIVVTGQVCLCYIPDQMTLPVYLGTSCCVLAILLPTGDSLFTSFCSPGILLPKWQLLTKHHNTIFTYSLHFLTLSLLLETRILFSRSLNFFFLIFRLICLPKHLAWTCLDFCHLFILLDYHGSCDHNQYLSSFPHIVSGI